MKVFCISDEEESSSDEYTDAGDSDADEAASPPPAAPARPARHDMYFSDDSFGYDEYSDDGKPILTYLLYTLIYTNNIKKNRRYICNVRREIPKLIILF